jgi:site-specific DNA recombinase
VKRITNTAACSATSSAEPRTSVKMVRCAIYTRKSTEEGLEQEFNSLDAQREAGEAYTRSQAGEGWALVGERYDDGGYTGANTERPGLQRLLADIDAGKIDCVVVYKVDRLSRSLLDYAQLMRTFEQKVSFVSVTQQFNTATSMGRLVLNVLLLRPVRAGNHLRTHPRQDRCDAQEGQVGRRTSATRLRRGSRWLQTYRQLERGGAGAADLRSLSGTRLAPAVVEELVKRGWATKKWATRKGPERGG